MTDTIALRSDVNAEVRDVIERAIGSAPNKG